MKRFIGFIVFIAMVGGAVCVGVASGGSERSEQRVAGQLYEVVDEQTRAEIFAFRALANNDLMNPFGKRTYVGPNEEGPSETDGVWLVGFGASDCEPRGGTFTCRGLDGENEPGAAHAGTDVTVALTQGRWEVLDVVGSMLPDERARVVGYSLPDGREPSHWDFAAVGTWQTDEDVVVSMMPIWVGAYPTQAPGSACQVDVNGITEEIFYAERPDQPHERATWVRGARLQKMKDADEVTVTCEQYTGAGWEIDGLPRLVGSPGQARGVEADLIWRGDENFTTPIRCDATLLDEDGEVVWEGREFQPALRPPNKGADYPYKNEVYVNSPRPVDAYEVGNLTCESL